MEHAENPSPAKPLYARVVRALIVGVLAVLLFYLKVLGTILKLGIRMVKGAPAGARK